MKRAFVIAMESEAEAILRRLDAVRGGEAYGRTFYEGRLGGESAAVVVCGIGKVNAAAATQLALDRWQPESIVNLGVAGGLDARLKIGEVFAISRCFQCDFDLSEVNHTPRGTPDEYDTPWFELASAAADLPRAICATGDFYSNRDGDYDFVHGQMGATLRDMELGAIGHVCRRAQVPCMALKAVSDVHVPGLPPPTEQFSVNLATAVDALAVKVEELWK